MSSTLGLSSFLGDVFVECWKEPLADPGAAFSPGAGSHKAEGLVIRRERVGPRVFRKDGNSSWIRWRSSPDGSDIEATRSLVKGLVNVLRAEPCERRGKCWPRTTSLCFGMPTQAGSNVGRGVCPHPSQVWAGVSIWAAMCLCSETRICSRRGTGGGVHPLWADSLDLH